jgi:phenylpropionate dioxygenase-like ring-hydroxylating dioxygenase large terminal subunit
MEAAQRVVTPLQRRRTWPRYDAAGLGFRNYWYPVAFSREFGKKARSVQMLGEQIMFYREGKRVYAFRDQCPHRGIPLSVGRQEFPGTWTCRYHGWTFELGTGELKAALTDGPDSPVCGKVSVRSYPVEERAGLVWVYMGEGKAPPVEEDIPEAFLQSDSVIVGRITERRGNWRYAAENGFDEAHAKYLHRYGSLRTLFSQLPAWGIPKIVQDEPWITRAKIPGQAAFESDYPGLGRWPKTRFWKKIIRRRGGTLSVRLPGLLRSQYLADAHYEWYVPIDEHQHRYLQFLVTRARGLGALFYRLRYFLYRRWLFHVQFNNQDAWMVELMPETSPERLFRPDVSITAWRRLCEHARGEEDGKISLEQQLREMHAETQVAAEGDR